MIFFCDKYICDFVEIGYVFTSVCLAVGSSVLLKRLAITWIWIKLSDMIDQYLVCMVHLIINISEYPDLLVEILLIVIYLCKDA